MRVLVIPIEGEMYEVQIEGSDVDRLRVLQGLVSGPIEVLPVSRGLGAYINEEGKNQQLPGNPRATKLMNGKLRSNDWIAGPMVLFGNDGTAEEKDIPAEYLVGIKALFG